MNRLFAGAALGSAVAFSSAVAQSSATPTPTAAPRLSGGFGKAPATPVAPTQGGQSLKDVVRAASESKQTKATPRPGVAITNQTLVTDPNRGRLTTWKPTHGPAPSASAAKAPAAKMETPAPSPTPEPDSATEEARWREIARRTRERVAQARDSVSAFEAESRKLENDFYAWDDGLYRDNVIKPAWDKKREELETARRELDEAEKDLADLPDKARKAGALPGWIRE